MERNYLYSNIAMKKSRFKFILFLMISLAITILVDIGLEFYKKSSSKITLLEHIQVSFSSSKFFNIIFVMGLIIIIILLFTLCSFLLNPDSMIIYIALFNLFRLIPCLIDLINLFFIYQYKIKFLDTKKSSIIKIEVKITKKLLTYFILTFTCAFMRLLINLDFIRRRFHTRIKQQLLIVFDLLLFILISISLIRYLNRNLFRIGQKVILGILIYQLNDAVCNENLWHFDTIWNEKLLDYLHEPFPKKLVFWILNRWKINSQFIYVYIISIILSIRWLISLFIALLYIFYIFQSGININDLAITSSEYIYIFLKFNAAHLLICTLIFAIINYDTSETRKMLKQHAISYFHYETDSSTETIETECDLNLGKICIVCCDVKDPNEFMLNIMTNDCFHLNRSICNSCLIRHVEQTCQITFTDDIYCPETNCRAKFNYDTVRSILNLSHNENLVERYDRYILYRQLEKMDGFIWCSNPLCNVGQINKGGVSNNVVTCFRCRKKTCFLHKTAWHAGLSCEEYDQVNDVNYKSSRRWILENSKKCPNCPYRIEKNDGCDHMTCIKCRHEFCWLCLAPFQPIRKYGNDRHNPTCKHYK